MNKKKEIKRLKKHLKDLKENTLGVKIVTESGDELKHITENGMVSNLFTVDFFLIVKNDSEIESLFGCELPDWADSLKN